VLLPFPAIPYFSLAIFSTSLNRSPRSSPGVASEHDIKPCLTAIAAAAPPPDSHLCSAKHFGGVDNVVAAVGAAMDGVIASHFVAASGYVAHWWHDVNHLQNV